MEATNTLAYARLDDETAVVEAIQADFKQIADSLVDPGNPDAALWSAHLGEPSAYGGLFPAWVFYRVTTEGNAQLSDAKERMLAGSYVCQILVLDRAQMPAGGIDSGRGFAERRTREGFQAWLKILAESYEIHGRATGGIARGAVTSGSHSEFGRAMFWDEQDNILWATSAEIQVKP